MTFLSFYQFLLSIFLTFEWKNVSQISNYDKVLTINGKWENQNHGKCGSHLAHTDMCIYIHISQHQVANCHIPEKITL